MIIFINDIPVRILKEEERPDPAYINHTLDASKEEITPARLINHVLIENVTETDFDQLLDLLNLKVPANLLSLDLSVKNYLRIKTYLRGRFKIIKAAGGLIRRKEKFLMIYRMKKWDLPKGKREKKERYRETAVREVEEECNITVRIGPKVCTTWHTYTMNKSAMLKKTRWYIMDVVDESKMTPNKEEDIEELRWMSRKEVYHALTHSYKSISYVFERYYALTDVKTTR